MRQPSDADALILCRCVADRVTMTEADAAGFLKGWMLEDIVRNGRKVGFFMCKGSEVHVCTLPEVRNRSVLRGDILKMFRVLMGLYGEVVTMVMNDNPVGHKFVRRIGFEPVRHDEKMTFYRLEACRYV